MRTLDERTERTLREVAQIMTARGYPMSWQAVQATERRALRKMAAAFRKMGINPDWLPDTTSGERLPRIRTGRRR